LKNYAFASVTYRFIAEFCDFFFWLHVVHSFDIIDNLRCYIKTKMMPEGSLSTFTKITVCKPLINWESKMAKNITCGFGCHHFNLETNIQQYIM